MRRARGPRPSLYQVTDPEILSLLAGANVDAQLREGACFLKKKKRRKSDRKADRKSDNKADGNSDDKQDGISDVVGSREKEADRRQKEAGPTAPTLLGPQTPGSPAGDADGTEPRAKPWERYLETDDRGKTLNRSGTIVGEIREILGWVDEGTVTLTEWERETFLPDVLTDQEQGQFKNALTEPQAKTLWEIRRKALRQRNIYLKTSDYEINPRPISEIPMPPDEDLAGAQDEVDERDRMPEGPKPAASPATATPASPKPHKERPSGGVISLEARARAEALMPSISKHSAKSRT